MAAIIDITNLTFDPSKYTEVKDLDFLGNELSGKLKVVIDQNGKQYLRAEYDISFVEDQKVFFRNISFLSNFSHPCIAKLEGFSFFGVNENLGTFTILSEYPENEFLLEFLEKVKKGIIPSFDDTAKSKFLFGTAFIGYFLHSRGIIHRCFAPPSFGVTKDLEPILMTMSSSKSLSQNINQTILGGNVPWTAPETDETDLIQDPQFNNRADVFSFGTLIYYLLTGEVPFVKDTKGCFQQMKNKKKASEFIPTNIPEELSELLKECWQSNPALRPHFSDILTGFQSHLYLFPGTNLDEFDSYVEKLFSFKTPAPVAKIASHNEHLLNSVKTIYHSVIDTYKLKYNSKILNALYTIRDQTEEYEPLIIHISRPGGNLKKWLRVPPFMFAASLCSKVKEVYGIPETFQKIEINDKILIDEPFLTMEQLRIKTGDYLKVYNSFGSKALGSNVLNLHIRDTDVSLAYLKDDTIDILINDISFSTRIPPEFIKLKFKGKEFKSSILDKKKPSTDASEKEEPESLEKLGIKENDMIQVETTFPNNPFKITLEFIDGSEKVAIDAYPTMKIQDMMKLAKINTLNCCAYYNKEILSLYKSFADYHIMESTTVMIHSIRRSDKD